MLLTKQKGQLGNRLSTEYFASMFKAWVHSCKMNKCNREKEGKEKVIMLYPSTGDAHDGFVSLGV